MRSIFLLSILGLSCACVNGAAYNVLYSFAGGPNDGELPAGDVTVVGSNLYGMTAHGGTNNAGVIFGYDLASGNETVYHSFGGNGDGGLPQASLLQSGSVLYGAAQGGGTGGSGVIIAFDTITDTETVLHSLIGPTDGASPNSALIQSGSILYGTTDGSTVNSVGTVFAFDISTNSYTVLHYFTGRPSDGNGPTGVVQSGTMLYGTTGGGGTNNGGTIYSIDPTNDTETILHSFSAPLSTSSDGNGPNGTPTLIGSTLYGQTAFGGTLNGGVIYAFNTITDAYSIVYEVGGGPGGLVADGSVLYGMSNNYIFSFDTTDDVYTVLHSFGSKGDGFNPRGDLTLVGSTLYGMTATGGANGRGTIFSLAIPEPATFSLMAVFGGCLLLRRRRFRPASAR